MGIVYFKPHFSQMTFVLETQALQAITTWALSYILVHALSNIYADEFKMKCQCS
jgi:hypothetical protein